MVGKDCLRHGKRIRAQAGSSRLSRDEKIKLLAAIQEFGIGTATLDTPVQDLDQLFHLANRWKAELEQDIIRQDEGNVVFVNFGREV
ncbi:MAG: hypothetical protein K6U11_14405 [bacterium]|nr:hypothetical protein [bacterium]